MHNHFNILDHPIIFTFPRRLTPFSSWHEHIPFAMLLVDILKPRAIVELGTQYGDSYCAFCQAVQELGLNTLCYAIDTWQGDPHTGPYSPEVLAHLREHHDPLYGSFSRLMQSTFDEALEHFNEGTVDLLHIDGYHTYDAVRHDFESWLPKMSDCGVILFHDINVRERDFGVWRLWEELKGKYPHFEFLHGHGLGVLAVGREQPDAFQKLLAASPDEVLKIRRFFFDLGLRLKSKTEYQAQLDAEQKRFMQEINELKATMRVQEGSLIEKNQRLERLMAEQKGLNHKIEILQASLQEKEGEAIRLVEERERLTERINQLETTILNQQQEINDKVEQVQEMIELIRQKDRIIQEKDKQMLEGGRMKNPLVSVIMPAYNHERYVGEAIESVLNQTFTDFEFIIINDGSTDSTDEIVRGYKDTRIRYYTQENMDAPNTINRGINLSNGKYISIIKSDDIYHPDRLAVLVDTAESKDARFIATDLIFIDESSKVIEDPLFKYNSWYNRLKSKYLKSQSLEAVFLSGNLAITTSNFFFHNQVPLDVGFFNSYRFTHDYDFVLRALAKYPDKFHFLIDKKLLLYRLHGENTVKESPLKKRKEMLNILAERVPDFIQNKEDKILVRKALVKIKKQYNRMAREVRVMKNTKSWKITAPLRLLNERYLNLKKVLTKKYKKIRRSLSREDGNKYALRQKGKAAHSFDKRAKQQNGYFDYSSEMNKGRDINLTPLLPYIKTFETDIRLIAFYLPQFHPIPENDEWWGKGFTEWTNVKRAAPKFLGHYQPRLPGELGFYDLRFPEVQKRQIELAKQHGIYGFCFHFYWFAGKRLLERPLEQFLSDPEMDFPFCINWANENWTRRWDGRDMDILIAQDHSPEDDIAFIKYVSKYLKDRRYIRVHNKPLLIVYRPALLPDAKETAERWRDWCRKNGIGEIYLALTHSFEHIDPREIGFDAAIEFPPNTFPLKDISGQVQLVNDGYRGRVFDYNQLLSISRAYNKPPYKKFRGICPGWDNEARRPGRGTTLINSSPEAYQEWLRDLCDFTVKNFDPNERLIFINAWNEWAEGAYLEPDRRYGYAYLQGTAEVLSDFSKESRSFPGRWRILFVSHDAARGGAQSVFLNMISWFKKHTAINLKILSFEGGMWLQRFKELGPTLVLNDLKERGFTDDELARHIRGFCGGPIDLIYCNSAASGREYHLLDSLGAPIITHFHELEMSIKRYADDCIKDVLKHSAHFIVCSGAVKENLVNNHEVDASKVTLIYSSINPDESRRLLSNKEKQILRRKLGLKKNGFLIFGCGLGMSYRKGGDLFIDVARALRRRGLDNFHFYWIGGFDKGQRDSQYGHWVDHLSAMRKEGLDRYVTFLGLKDNPKDYFQAGDVFLLPSREDPFPLVALEAAECGLPIICFADAGGMPEFVEADAGFVVPYGDVEAVAEKIATLMENKDLRRRLGVRAREKLLSGFTIDQTTPQILSACRQVAQKKPAVSVIVPNHNHARYLPRRLDSIFAQTFKDFEVILLDDASTDNSMEILERYRSRADVQVVRNEVNTGSPCKQWLKGIDLARGDLLWIAESDDASEPQFLETLIPAFQNPEVKLAYADSLVIDENDRAMGDYVNCEYLTSLSKTKWKKSYQVSATDEINDGLGVKNTILNISAVLFRRFKFGEEFRKTIEGMRIAGDWYFIVHAIKNGKVHYQAKKLNYHRRHSESVIGKTVSEKRIEDFFREFHMVQEFIVQNYELKDSFRERWESYLRNLWNDFCPSRPFEELKRYYPLDEMKEKLLLISSKSVKYSNNLITRAKNEASVWANSGYYEVAEQWMHVFWSEDSDFRTLFGQLDLTTVLELACGHGRHSEYILKHYASAIGNMICMDVNDSNIEFCKERLKDRKNVKVIKNNGIDFYPINDNSVSSIFCYDAMVHFHKDVVASYLKDTYRVLKPGGKALYHHSNFSKSLHTHFGQNPHARAFMTQELFKEMCHQAGLEILQQKVIHWGNEKDLDCISLLGKPTDNKDLVQRRIVHKVARPIIVYNMGKVGSRSVYETLVDLNLGVKVHHAHVLEELDSMAETIKREFANPVNSLAVIEQGKRLRQSIDKEPDKQWDIITLVRDPVAQTVSRFFQSIEEVIPDIRQRLENNAVQIEEIFDVFINKWPRYPALIWFDTQFKTVFNIDVFSKPFPRESGYEILKNERFYVLIIRLENLDSCAQKAFEEFLGIPGLKLKKSNLGAHKWYKDTYQQFLSNIILPDEYLDQMYNSKLAQHFYSEEEIRAFRAKWTQR